MSSLAAGNTAPSRQSELCSARLARGLRGFWAGARPKRGRRGGALAGAVPVDVSPRDPAERGHNRAERSPVDVELGHQLLVEAAPRLRGGPPAYGTDAIGGVAILIDRAQHEAREL